MNRRLNKAERAVINRKLHALAAELVSREREALYQFFEESIGSDVENVALIESAMEKVALELIPPPPLNVQPEKQLPF